eukprot:gnl/Hemi2/157_TR46_c0_g1_i1.p1 gnl/Hemi2/157_TR46_c0_g1~~gnl/Hemi2/157_TR46_c0_g1_i1.p1  ORF type:complete len:630 (+),score=201.46 gnl/Hemi2/157_TR46_c0_g1_i1:135-2024(+)
MSCSKTLCLALLAALVCSVVADLDPSCSTADSTGACTLCNPGFVGPTTGDGNSACTPCPSGWFSRGPQPPSLEFCAGMQAGVGCASFDPTGACTSCSLEFGLPTIPGDEFTSDGCTMLGSSGLPSNTTVDPSCNTTNSTGACTLCNPGFAGPTMGDGNAACTPCVLGSFSRGLVAPSSVNCPGSLLGIGCQEFDATGICTNCMDGYGAPPVTGTLAVSDACSATEIGAPTNDDLCVNGTLTIVESIPEFLALNSTSLSTHQGWAKILKQAKHSIDVAMFYMTLTDGTALAPEYGGWMGDDIFSHFKHAARRGVKIRMVQNEPSASFPDIDSQRLANESLAEVRNINWVKLVGSGILHTKTIIVDKKHAYVGSANMDWRSLSQVKELGLIVENCSSLALDINRAFNIYWDAANMTVLPNAWPAADAASFNVSAPAKMMLNGEPTSVYLASSPASFCSTHRTNDIDALVNVINEAESSVSISVMDYAASYLYMPGHKNPYWPVIDDALRSAAFGRNVSVRLMMAKWNYSDPILFSFLKSINGFAGVCVKLFEIPDFPGVQVPYTRVNHAKYMVSDKAAYVGTSNWSADYFLNTGGLSLNVQNEGVRSQLQAIFDRDWNSPFAHSLDPSVNC